MLDLESQLRTPWWHRAAACRDADPDLFFIERGWNSRAAKAYCAACPVRGACLEWAMSRPDMFDIWGGLTPVERKAEKRRRRVAALVA